MKLDINEDIFISDGKCYNRRVCNKTKSLYKLTTTL